MEKYEKMNMGIGIGIAEGSSGAWKVERSTRHHVTASSTFSRLGFQLHYGVCGQPSRLALAFA